MTKFWQAIEVLPKLACVSAEWKSLLGDEHKFVASLIRVRTQVASSYPNPDGGCPFDIVQHGPDDFVGICAETRARIILRREQLLIHELDLDQTAKRIASAFGLTTATRLGDSGRLWSLGSVRQNGKLVPVYLLLARDNDELNGRVSTLLAQRQAPFVVLAPSAGGLSGELTLQLRAEHSAIVPLTQVILVSKGGDWTVDIPEVEAALAHAGINTNGGLQPKNVIQFIGGDRIGSDRDSIQLPQEEKAIREGIQLGAVRESFVFAQSIFAANINDVAGCLSNSPTIIHFAGHGSGRRLALLRSNGVRVDLTHLDLGDAARLFEHFPKNLRLTVFSACKSSDLARYLTDHGVVELAIGVEGSLSDDLAIEFAKTFYLRLAEGDTVLQAFGIAKIHFSGVTEAGRPQLFTAANTDPATIAFARRE